MEHTNEPYFQTFLRDEFSRRKGKHPGYSLRQFARSLQIDATALSRILNGKEVMSIRTTSTVLRNMELDRQEKEKVISSVLDCLKRRWFNDTTL